MALEAVKHSWKARRVEAREEGKVAIELKMNEKLVADPTVLASMEEVLDLTMWVLTSMMGPRHRADIQVCLCVMLQRHKLCKHTLGICRER